MLEPEAPPPGAPAESSGQRLPLHTHSLHTSDCTTGATHAPRSPLTAASTTCGQGVSDKLTSTRAS